MSGEHACCGEGASTLIFACSGAFSVGQIANDVAMALSRARLGTMSCIAAIGAHLDGFVVSEGFEKKHGVAPGAKEIERGRALVAGRMKGS